MDINHIIANKIKSRRKLLGISQRELANKAGVTYQQIQKYEYAKDQIPLTRLVKISPALSMNITDFFTSPQGSEHNIETDISYSTINLVKLYNKLPSNQQKAVLDLIRQLAN